MIIKGDFRITPRLYLSIPGYFVLMIHTQKAALPARAATEVWNFRPPYLRFNEWSKASVGDNKGDAWRVFFLGIELRDFWRQNSDINGVVAQTVVFCLKFSPRMIKPYIYIEIKP